MFVSIFSRRGLVVLGVDCFVVVMVGSGGGGGGGCCVRFVSGSQMQVIELSLLELSSFV